MTDQYAELDVALERVIESARGHLVAIKAAKGRIDDDDVWQAYVRLNNTSFAYDEVLLDAFGEVTPWDVESIDPDEADQRFAVSLGVDGSQPADPHPQVVSVRQRRDYRVPSLAALLRIAEAARRDAVPDNDEVGPIESVGEAVLELLQAGDGSLSSLDVPQLEPLDGLLTVSEIAIPLDLEAYAEDDGIGPFTPTDGDLLVGRLDEHPFPDDGEFDPDHADQDHNHHQR